MALMTRGPLAGVAALTINGDVWNVVGELEYRPNGYANETLKGQSAVEGFSMMPLEGVISCTLRMRNDKKVSSLQAASPLTIVAELANGVVVTGTEMWQVGELEVNTQEGTFKFTANGASVVEDLPGGN